MTENAKLLAALEAWQKTRYVHPLTCGVDSSHRVLVPYIDPDARVCLKCVDCDYRQVVTGTRLEGFVRGFAARPSSRETTNGK